MGVTSECRSIRRDLLRRNELDAVRRGQLNVHLRRCAACREIAQDLTSIEAGIGEIAVIDEDRKQRIYAQLVPAVNEIANDTGNEVPTLIDRLWRPRPAYAWGMGFTVALVVLALSFVRFSSDEASSDAELLANSPAVAEKNITFSGLIDREEGDVTIDSDEDSGEAVGKGRLAVRKGTRIAVSKDGRFSFRIGEVARVALSSETDWQLTASTDTYLAIQLDKGRLAVDFDGNSGRVMEITTPDSLVRVKGTVFTVEALPDGKTRVGVLEGLVEVVSRRGETRTVEVGEGQLATVPGDGVLADVTDEQRSIAAELTVADAYPEELTRLVRFDGSPERVKVEIDGRVLGTTPLTVRLPTGPFTYRLTSPGMEPVVGNVVKREGLSEVDFALMPIDDYELIEEDRSRSKKKIARQRKSSRKRSAKRGWGLFNRAQAAMTAGDIPYAIGLLERAIKSVSGKQLGRGLALLAECYTAVGMYSKAAKTFDRIVEKSPSSAAAQNARYEVGRLSMDQLGDMARARAAFTAYVASPLGGGLREEAYYSLCELDGREGARRDSLHCFNQFLRAFPGGHHGPDARLWRGVLYQEIDKNWASAERDLLSFIRARPRHPRADEARYRVVIGRFQVGDKRGTLRMISEYMRKHPQGQYRLRVERIRRSILDPNISWELEAK